MDIRLEFPPGVDAAATAEGTGEEVGNTGGSAETEPLPND
jgi:hypothetical protein